MVRKNVVDENALKFMAVKRNKRLTGSEASKLWSKKKKILVSIVLRARFYLSKICFLFLNINLLSIHCTDKLSTLLTNTKESNAQMIIRKLSLTKEIQELFKKINAIFQVLTADDRIDDFNEDKKKEIEYDVIKSIAALEVQLNHEINAYVALKNPNTAKQLKKTDATKSREEVKPSAAIKNVKRNDEPVLPVDVNEIRKECFKIPASAKITDSGHLVGISKAPTASQTLSKKWLWKTEYTFTHCEDTSE